MLAIAQDIDRSIASEHTPFPLRGARGPSKAALSPNLRL